MASGKWVWPQRRGVASPPSGLVGSESTGGEACPRRGGARGGASGGGAWPRQLSFPTAAGGQGSRGVAEPRAELSAAGWGASRVARLASGRKNTEPAGEPGLVGGGRPDELKPSLLSVALCQAGSSHLSGNK